MKADWEVKKLGELCKLTRGHNPPKSNFINEPKVGYVRFYQIRDGWADDYAVYVPDTPQLHKVNPDEILMVAYRHIGKVFRGVSGAFNVALCKISNKDRNKLDDDFLFYLIPTDVVKGELMKRSERSLIPSMSVEDLKEIKIPLPPLAEQQRIVAILNEAFAAIDKAKENAQKNLQNARELFDSYLQSVFANPGEDWEEKTLGQIAEFRNGLNFTKSSRGEVIKIVGVKDFQKNFWVPSENLETVTTSGSLNSIDCLKEGDILAVRSNGNQELIGRCILSGPVLEKTSHSGFTIRIRLNQQEAFSSYLCHFLKSKEARKQLIESGTGTNIKSLNQGALSSLIIPLPSFKDQQAIVNQIEIVLTEAKKLEAIYQQKLTDLDELKKTILQKAFQGELTTTPANAVTA